MIIKSATESVAICLQNGSDQEQDAVQRENYRDEDKLGTIYIFCCICLVKFGKLDMAMP